MRFLLKDGIKLFYSDNTLFFYLKTVESNTHVTSKFKHNFYTKIYYLIFFKKIIQKRNVKTMISLNLIRYY